MGIKHSAKKRYHDRDFEGIPCLRFVWCTLACRGTRYVVKYAVVCVPCGQSESGDEQLVLDPDEFDELRMLSVTYPNGDEPVDYVRLRSKLRRAAAAVQLTFSYVDSDAVLVTGLVRDIERRARSLLDEYACLISMSTVRGIDTESERRAKLQEALLCTTIMHQIMLSFNRRHRVHMFEPFRFKTVYDQMSVEEEIRLLGLSQWMQVVSTNMASLSDEVKVRVVIQLTSWILLTESLGFN